MNENNQTILYNEINNDIEELSNLIIKQYNIKHHGNSQEIVNWIAMRLTAITNIIEDNITKYNKLEYKKARRK